MEAERAAYRNQLKAATVEMWTKFNTSVLLTETARDLILEKFNDIDTEGGKKEATGQLTRDNFKDKNRAAQNIKMEFWNAMLQEMDDDDNQSIDKDEFVWYFVMKALEGPWDEDVGQLANFIPYQDALTPANLVKVTRQIVTHMVHMLLEAYENHEDAAFKKAASLTKSP